MEENEAIAKLERYVLEDVIYQDYLKTPNAYRSDFDEFCIEHCECIEKLISLVKSIKND